MRSQRAKPSIGKKRRAGARELARYKRLLLAKHRELEGEMWEGAAPVPPAGGPQGDLMDQADADAQAELHIRLRQTDSRLLRAVEAALARLRRGSYGVCEVCQRPIAKARLNVVPWTRLCRGCKEQQRSA